ncbi:MAG TPA: alpha/beta hydrolase, partial [Rhodospirillaceae bacterium]|nr:alpha/beta hydrolase [Rhodospirillaceae bacterium]
EAWRDRAVAPEGHAIESGHFLAEENPTDTLAAFKKFFKC